MLVQVATEQDWCARVMTMRIMSREDAFAVCRWPELRAPYAEALREAVRFIIESFEPTAIVAAGSVVRGGGDRSSDLDIYVVHEALFRQRLQRWFGGVPAEIFVNPPAAIREYFRTEYAEGRPCTAHMLATGYAVLGGETFDTLREEAVEWLSKRSFLSPQEVTVQRYMAATLIEDGEDVAQQDPAMASALLGEAVLTMLRYYTRIRNGALPSTKRLLVEVEHLDPPLARAARLFFGSSGIDERIALAHEIADFCIQARGFFEWDSERSPVALPTAPDAQSRKA
jgi:hypothetical protein